MADFIRVGSQSFRRVSAVLDNRSTAQTTLSRTVQTDICMAVPRETQEAARYGAALAQHLPNGGAVPQWKSYNTEKSMVLVNY